MLPRSKRAPAPGRMMAASFGVPACAENARVEVKTPAEMRKLIPEDLAKSDTVAKDAGMPKQ